MVCYPDDIVLLVDTENDIKKLFLERSYHLLKI